MEYEFFPKFSPDYNFFPEDVVCKATKKKYVNIGVVTQDSPNRCKRLPRWNRTKQGDITVPVAWYPNDVQAVTTERKVKLCDRYLMPGYGVRKFVKGMDSQLGYCKSISVKADVQIKGTRKVIIGVDSKDLMPLEEIVPGVIVFKDSLLGKVKNVKKELILRCNDGSRCIMSDVDAFDLDDTFRRREKELGLKNYSFYPGQQLWGPTFCFYKVKWLNITKAMSDTMRCPNKSVLVVVEDVKIVSAGINWSLKPLDPKNVQNQKRQPEYHAMQNIDDILRRKFEIVTGNDLKSIRIINTFKPLQIGDRNFLVLKRNYEIISLAQWKTRMAHRMNLDNRDSPIHKQKSAISAAKEICIDSNVHFNDADNTCDDSSDYEDIEDEVDEKSPDSASTSSLETYLGLNKKRKKRPNYTTKLLKKKKCVSWQAVKHMMKETSLKPGKKLATEVLFTETKAHVIWQDGTVEHNVSSTDLYPAYLYDVKFFPGDCVVNSKEVKPHEYGVVKQADDNERTALVTWVKTNHDGVDSPPVVLSEEEISMYDIKVHPDYFRKYQRGSYVIQIENPVDSNLELNIGQIVGIHPSGKIEISMVSGETSLCYPQELYTAEFGLLCSMWNLGGETCDWSDDDLFSDDDRWETESEKSVLGDEEELGEKYIDEICKEFKKDSIKLEKKDDKSEEHKPLAKIERLQGRMAHLEELFTQNSSLPSINVMSSLWKLYKHCKILEHSLALNYFSGKHLQSVVESLRRPERCGSPTSANLSKSRKLWHELCAILKSSLSKAHNYELKFYTRFHSETYRTFIDTVCTFHNDVLSNETNKSEPSKLVSECKNKENDNEKEALYPIKETLSEINTVGQVGTFSMLESVPDGHKYKHSTFQPTEPSAFFRTVKKEINILRSSLPEGIIVKSFEDRIDLYSVLIEGPKGTPYEDGLFFFDLLLPADYPKVPPLCHYISYSSEGLNPNLYVNGMVCVSLLGTWEGKGSEKWNPETSNLLQVLVSIQGLILVAEPYYNEPLNTSKYTPEKGKERSRMYNEVVILQLIESMTKLLLNPPEIFKQEVTEHFKSRTSELVQRLERWISISESWNSKCSGPSASSSAVKELHNCDISAQDGLFPEFPLLPTLKGFRLSLQKSLAKFKEVMQSCNIQLS